MRNRTGKNLKWLFWTIGLLLFMIVLSICAQKKLVHTFVGVLFLVFSIMVGTVLKAYFGEERKGRSQNDAMELLSEKDYKSSQKLLRYATAILAFVSLTTTAQGMKSFTFDSSLLSYLASFAVQSILVVFSLLLCRFFVYITRLSWAKYIKRIVCYLMVVFFCATLMVSSLFSYSYIANYAYKDTQLNDREVVVREYLLDVTYLLYQENEERGKIILDSIKNSANNVLRDIIGTDESDENSSLVSGLKMQIEEIDFDRMRLEKIDLDEIDFEGDDFDRWLSDLAVLDEQEWKSRFPEFEDEIESLCLQYENYRNDYAKKVKEYIRILKEVKNWGNVETDLQTVIKRCGEIIYDLEKFPEDLDRTLGTMYKNWRGNQSELYNDVRSKRSFFENKWNDLCDLASRLKDNVLEIQESARSTSAAETAMDDILSQLYLLGIDKEDGNEKVELNSLVMQVSDLAISLSADKTFKAEVLAEVVLLSNHLVQYFEYFELKGELERYIKEDLRKVYYIVEDEMNLSEKYGNNKMPTDSDSLVYTVTETEWKDIRNKDFDLFYACIKSLPDTSVEELEDKNVEGSILKNQDRFEVTGIMKKASEYQRDLLGELTDFERAYNYLKYQFRVMALFSLFLAVFFDLGAFFVGSFIFATEYFKEGKRD